MLHVSSFLYSALSSTDSPLGPGVQLDKTRSLLQGVPSSGGRVRKSGTYERVRVSLEEELEAAEVSSVSSEPGTLPFLTGTSALAASLLPTSFLSFPFHFPVTAENHLQTQIMSCRPFLFKISQYFH